MNFKLGNLDTKLYIGSTEIQSIYLGENKIYENEITGVVLDGDDIRLLSDDGDFYIGNEIYNHPIISKYSNGAFDMNGYNYGEFSYDEMPTGTIINTENFYIQELENVNLKDSSDTYCKCLILPQNGTLTNVNIGSGLIAIKSDSGCTIEDLNINGGKVYIIADNLNIDIKQNSGILYLVTNNSIGTLNLTGGERYLSGNNNLNLNLYSGTTYVDDTDLSNFLTNFVGSGTADIQGGFTDDFIWG